jgi:steroid 5-alpha reductase family enzyme
MAVLVTLWGTRLTYNFSRRGAYVWPIWKGEEDYRWGVLRSQPPLNKKLNWTLFNLFFISLYQNTLIWLFTLPAVMAAGTPASITWVDYLLAFLLVVLLIMETVADQQQWNYQTEKYRRIKNQEALTGGYKKGFTHTGLWKWMRHPNYAAEQGIWLVFYFFSVAATGKWINWSLAGAVLLVLLFQGSCDFSEKISSTKYPAYKEYMRKTGRFFPKFF